MLSDPGRKVGLALELIRERGMLYVLRYMAAGYGQKIGRLGRKSTRLARARVLRQPLVYVIGDSHTWMLADCPMAIIHNIGPATAFNLANPDSNGHYGARLDAIARRLDRGRDCVLLIFGEIDCRVHIYHQYAKSGGTTTISDLIDQTILNYGEIMGRLKDRGVHFGVCSVVPATGHVMRYPVYATAAMRRRLYREFTLRYPHQATPEVATAINREFNDKLKQYCREHGYPYCDLYRKIADERGFMKEEYRLDEIHANGRAGAIVGRWLARELVHPALQARDWQYYNADPARD